MPHHRGCVERGEGPGSRLYDLAGPGNQGRDVSDVDVRNAINRGLIRGPSTTGGIPWKGIRSWIRRRQYARDQVGVDLIKIYSTHRFRFTPDGKLAAIPTFTLEKIRAMSTKRTARE
jgi:hypothetical protein